MTDDRRHTAIIAGVMALATAAILLTALWPSRAAGQVADSVRLRAAVDTLRVEGCRGGTITASGACSGRRYAARSTVVHRQAARLDSLVRRPAGPAAVARVALSYRWISSYYYDSDAPFRAQPGVDTVTVCAVIRTPQDTVGVVAWPPIRARVHGDSLSWGERSGNPLSVMCGPALARWGRQVTTDSLTAPRVVWAPMVIQHQGRRMVVPSPRVP